jgi:hypothetical protein
VVAIAGAREELRNVRTRKQRASLLHKLDVDDMDQASSSRIIKL